MTIANETSRVDLVGNGVNDTFTFTFEIYVKADLLVYVGGIQQTVDIHYTVPDEAIENPDGGTIVFGEDYIPALDAVVSIILNLPYTQLIDYVEADKFPAETHERGLDRLVKIAQQHKEKLSRTPSVAISSALSNLIIPEAASRAIGWDALGEELTTYPITPVLDANWDSIQNYDNDLATAVATIGAGAKTLLIDVSTESVIANLEVPETLELYPTRTGLITVDNCILTINRLSEAVGPHKIFNCINGGTVSFDPGAVKEVSAEWWGNNTTPGTTDMTAESQAAITAAGSLVPVKFQGYTYMVSGLTFGTAAWLEGTNGTVIKLIAGSNTHVLDTSADTTTRLFIEDLRIDGNRANQTTAGNGINLAGGAYVLWAKLERVFITECYNYGLYIDNANIVSVEDGRIGECRYGAYVLDSEEVNFVGVNIELCDIYNLKYDTSISAAGRLADCWFEAGTTTPTDYIIINTHGIKVDSCRLAMGNGVDNGPTHSGINVLTGIGNCLITNNTAPGDLHPDATNFIVFDSGSKNNMSIGNRGGTGGTVAGGTTDEDGRNYILEQNTTDATYGIQQAGRNILTRGTLDNTGTPSVRDNNFFITGGTEPITDFDDGLEGQPIEIVARHGVVITQDVAKIILTGAGNLTLNVGDTVSLLLDAGIWKQTGGCDNT